MRLVVTLTALTTLSACATAVRGTTEDVTINYAPANATVVTSLNHTCQRSPCVVNVARKTPFTVTASAPGYVTQDVRVQTVVTKKGGTAIAGNVLAGGIIGLGVDAATGAGRDHTPNPVNIDLKRAGTS